MDRRADAAAVALAALAGVVVYLIAAGVFPYHSTNHDEAVYLQQAAMLLDGRLVLRPPVLEAFRPWFFVEDGGRLYPKYAPVPAAMFAAGKLLGGARLSLAGIAAANVALASAVVSEAFDRRTGLLAAAFLLASPLFLVDSSVFLPYAPALLWELLFALAYLRADRTGRPEWAAVAGLAVGVAFFARPYTAVVFATPFVAHALWTLRGLDRGAVARHGVTAALGLAGVAVALGYNALVTGSPWLFPYEAFAPRDGPGFGRRAVLGYEREYTPALALRSNARALVAFATEWIAAGPLGAALAGAGLGAVLLRFREEVDPYRAVLVGVAASVVAGNLYFWGTLNTLGALEDPNDGLVSLLGPYYHFDLLVPTAAFAAHGTRLAAGGLDRRARTRLPTRRARAVVAAGLVVGATVLAGAGIAVAAGPLADNAAVSDNLRRAYAPLEEREFEGALVFLPTPYGDWLGHPFQPLRNDPGYDGAVVYALEERPFAVVDAFPDRTLYRYTYRGRWAPYAGRSVEPHLQRVRAVRGERIVLRATLGIPDGAERVSVRVATADGRAYYAVNGTPARLRLRLVVAGGEAWLAGPVEPVGPSRLPVAERDEITVEAFVGYGAGGFSYRLRVPVARSGGTVRALTPYREVCRRPLRCGGEAAYVPNATRPGVGIETALRADGA